MRRLNIARMKRYVARSTPDAVHEIFDPLSDTFYEDYQKWLHTFTTSMRIKYGSNVNIEVNMEDGLHKEKLVWARAVPYSDFRITHRED